MPIPLKIKTIEWSNFLSYGPYETQLDLNNLGPILIVGQRDGRSDESNGVGKTTITTAIVWCLFGRTPRKHAPGDKVVNWNSKSECYVKITTCDGWVITRTRKLNGHDDLLVHKDGEDITLSTNQNAQRLLRRLFNLDYDIFMASMFFGQRVESFLELSDQKRKAALERMLGLHRLNVWGDIAKERKQTAEIEQGRLVAVVEAKKGEISRFRMQLADVDGHLKSFEHDKADSITRIEFEISELEASVAAVRLPDLTAIRQQVGVERQKRNRLVELETQLTKAQLAVSQLDNEITEYKKLIAQQQQRLNSLSLVDIESLIGEHAQADVAEAEIAAIKTKIDDAELVRRRITHDISAAESTIRKWYDKAGTHCPTCEQQISQQHTDVLCKPYVEHVSQLKCELTNIESSIASLRAEINEYAVSRPRVTVEAAERDILEANTVKQHLKEIAEKTVKKIELRRKLNAIIDKTNASYNELKPSINNDIDQQLADAELVHAKHKESLTKITAAIARLESERSRKNPYQQLYDKLSLDLDSGNNELAIMLERISKLDSDIRLLEYIRRCYHDRNKIKMFVLSDLIPYLNQRIEYYLNAFECDLELRFTSTLSVETSKWDYGFHSGGQMKRIDLAIMFAMYDLYISMYGQQCNVMVLDEVDGSLDAHGVRAFVDVIANDFSGGRPDKPDTVLIISHKSEMVDQFANQIVVHQDADGYSRLIK